MQGTLAHSSGQRLFGGMTSAELIWQTGVYFQSGPIEARLAHSSFFPVASQAQSRYPSTAMHLALNGWFWNQPHTGSGQYTRYLVYYLNRLVSDLTITLVLPEAAGAPQDVPPSVQVRRVPVRGGQIGKVLFEQRGFPQACAAVGADLAHVPYWGSPLNSPVPVVVTVHDLTTALIREYRQSVQARLYNALVSAGARGAAAVIADSNASRDDIIRHLHIPAARVSTVYLGVDTELFRPEGNLVLDMAIQRQYDLPPFYIFYLGGYELHKNVPLLLHAYTYVARALGDDYPLLLAGKRPQKVSRTFPDYGRLIGELELDPYVRWLGFVADDHKPLLYRAATTFVFPSRAEGFGLPPLEAMACGTPVVTTNAGSLPEVVGEAGFAVAPDDVRGMAGAIIATVVQDNLAADLRGKGLERARTFSWEKTATETLLVYDRVLQAV